MSAVPIDITNAPVQARQVSAWQVFRRNKSAVTGLVILLIIVLATIFGPMLYRVSPFAVVGPTHLAPGASGAPLLGTDKLGRDIFAGILNGGRVTLLVGAAAAALSAVIGLVVGGLSGFYGGFADSALMRFTEFFQVLPALLLALVVVSLFGPNFLTITISIGIVTWPGTARLIRAEFLRIRQLEYVKAAKSIGARDLRIMLRLVLPNALPPALVYTTLIIGISMLLEAGLSFIGATNPNTLSWGLMLGDNRDQILVAWWPVVFPGLAIFFSVLSVSLIGDGLNDALNPKGRDR
ncbi:peptide/nickel transport system permease protein [Antricoccus suffuscus]|uniref:Peptide/nickel transport system permease protein n=1 Tax=Antricoccus suffuscus TaxID=1629062 RepID=A0A2T0ZZ05_9ACTN|nr:ABC transporter permease [Antricoccus suffuscus]PRZ41467.1 peptide/nickel transport system permease protein [Antricoccus suffuscus]